VTGPIPLPVSEYRITGGWLADLGSLKEKGQGDHKQLLKSHWNSRLKAHVSLKGTVGQRGLGHATNCSADSD